MCGINGIVNFDSQNHVTEQELKTMSSSQIHRGPDDEGYYTNKNVGFGFRRLSIIDLHTGHQPICNEDGTIWIVFNGEVYNFEENRRELIKRGHQFKTKTDTETIVHLYEEYGNKCVDHLRGMFAFAIWDDNKKKLFCARDRFGIKPFFYHLTDDRFVFGSEIKAVLAAGDINMDMDLVAMDSYFAYKYITDDRSIFKAIKKLKPAHSLEIDFGGRKPHVQIEKYWDITFEPDHDKTEQEWCEAVEAELTAAVKMRMISDVPLGAFLSGGVDSSIVVALMSRLSDKPIKTFSIGFKEKKYNELPYARAVAEMYNTEHHEQIINPESVSLLPKLVWGYDEPFADSSAIPTYYVSKFAREKVTVVLSGDGGDELFAGYNNYPKLERLNKYHMMPDAFNKVFWGGIHKVIPNSVKGKGISYYLSKEKETVGAHLALWTQLERYKLYKNGLRAQLGDEYAESYKEQILMDSTAKEYLSKMLELDMRTYMVDDILTKVDRASMLNSLEARVPILDHKVAELSFKIPSKFKLNDGDKKYILKKALGKYLPDSVINHPKQGFTVPMELWFRDSLKDYINDRLNSKNSILNQYFDINYIQKTVKDHQMGMRDLNTKIWSLIFIDIWLEQYHK